MSAAGAPAPVLPWRGAVLLLAIAQTVVWAGLYYSFAGLLARWEADLGWSKTELSAALTFALFASAAAAPFVGRLIDRGHGRKVLTFGAVAGAGLLVLLSMVSTQWEFMVVWVLIGCAMATTLYEPCFAFLTHHFAMEAKKPITLVSLVAGFAGTLSFPTAFAIAEWAGWRMSLIVFAAMILLITVPLTWIATGRVAIAMPHQPAVPLPGRSAKATDVLRGPVFWLIALAYASVAMNHGVIITHLMPLLGERGLEPETVVLAASMIGPMQVAGRLAMIAAERHVPIIWITAAAFASMAVAALALLGTVTQPVLIVAFVVLQGAGVGINSITRPVVTAMLLGRANFGAISGMLGTVNLSAFACSPLVAAWIWQLGGYQVVITCCFVLAVIATLAIPAALAVSRRT